MKLVYKLKRTSDIKYAAVLARKMNLIANFQIDSLKRRFPVFGEKIFNELLRDFDETYDRLRNSEKNGEKIDTKDLKYTKEYLEGIVSNFEDLLHSVKNEYNLGSLIFVDILLITVKVKVRCERVLNLLNRLKNKL